ncbi:50S ribosomal protein L1 [archaeon CG_4_10_14_0_2_um_filter_Archaea_38_6]|nr:MAG: 50S ribosomal protein L1 [archaeon CG07_land_8_20_14_0_80_38_8]PIU89268.1 MAG: 50S ribosomal protein L1 [archaeon CG06_land_8_20_14_3_00_37_11]PIX44110.1 MAG: 50S ribosomal protein L1 [archaeon CG_4_8_14_3_um_filter_38_5]PJA23125.1 MAG: 50S ribosomal protein L1 [archaeon CG_4_10_14_0_2_um_filter_Archaea_38_6]
MVGKKDIIEKVKEALDKRKQRKFSESIDLSIALKGLDLKNETIEHVVVLPHERGTPIRICGLVDKAMQTAAKENFDNVIMKDEFPKWANNLKKIRKLAEEYDYFVAQADIMGEIAKTFGRIFGPRNKMPNPKASCVVPPNADLKMLKSQLIKTVVLKTRKTPVINLKIGTDKQGAEIISDNINYLLEQFIPQLPNKEQNIKQVVIKTTMGPSIKIM